MHNAAARGPRMRIPLTVAGTFDNVGITVAVQTSLVPPLAI